MIPTLLWKHPWCIVRLFAHLIHWQDPFWLNHLWLLAQLGPARQPITDGTVSQDFLHHLFPLAVAGLHEFPCHMMTCPAPSQCLSITMAITPRRCCGGVLGNRMKFQQRKTGQLVCKPDLWPAQARQSMSIWQKISAVQRLCKWNSRIN